MNNSTKNIQLRPYQLDAVKQVQKKQQQGVDRLLLTAATGSGKTTIASAIITQAAYEKKKTLFIAHRRELINQAYSRLQDFGLPENHIGVIMANDQRQRPNAPVQVASIDTLRNRAKPAADLVFIDECHRALAPTYRDISDHYPQAFHIGLTATPYRMGGKGLSEAYDDILAISTPTELIKQGYLVEPRVFTIPKEKLPDVSSIRTRGGDYLESELALAVDQKSIVGNLVEHWFKHAKNVRTVVFAVSIAHSKHIVERFRRAGVTAEHLDGSTSVVVRDSILARLESGQTKIVTSCNVLAEGWDQPSVKCAILARPTRSTGLYIQQAGRILRPYNGQPAIILDHAGCVRQHGLPHENREYSLHTLDQVSHSEDHDAPVKECFNCSAILHLSVRICPHCGTVLGDKCEVPVERSGQLVEVLSRGHRSNVGQRTFELRRPGRKTLVFVFPETNHPNQQIS